MEWIKCELGQMPENDDRYAGRKIIKVLVTTDTGNVTKAQRELFKEEWYWARIGRAIAWMPLPEPYRE